MQILEQTSNHVLSKSNSWMKDTKSSIKVFWPLMISYFVQGITPFMTIWMISKLGNDALAGSGISSMIYMVAMVFLCGVLSAVSVLIAHNASSKAPIDEIRKIFTQAIIFSVVLSIPIMVIIWFSSYLLVWTGQNPAVVDFAKQNLHALSYSVLPLILLIAMEQFLIGLERTKLVLFISILQIPLEVAVSYAFVFGKCGLRAFGIAGVGYGLSLVFAVAAIIISIYIYFAKDFKEMRMFEMFRKKLSLDMRYILEIFKVGCPTGLLYVIEISAFAAAAIMIGKLDKDALVAHQLVLQFLNIPSLATYAISYSTATVVSYAVGEVNKDSAWRLFIINLLLGSFVVIVIGIFYCIFYKNLASLDIDVMKASNARVIGYILPLMIIGLLCVLCDNTKVVAVGALRAIKDTSTSMVTVFGSFWLLAIPLGYFLGFVYHFGVIGIWMSSAIGILCAAIFLSFRFKSKLKEVNLRDIVKIK